MLLKLNSLKEINTSIVLKYIMANQPISRAEISSGLGINKASLSEIVINLIQEKLVNEVGMGESTNLGGRKPVLLEFNHQAGVSIGIDLGVNSIRFMVSDLNGEELLKEKTEHRYSQRVNDIVDFLNTKKLLYKDLPYGIVGVTISVHGIVDNNKIVFTPNYDVFDIEELDGMFEFPVYFENEANLAAIAHVYQKEAEYESVAAITLRSGVGSGVVYNKEIYKGHESSAGEFGHMIVVPNGKLCSCGNQGCLEQYISEEAVVTKYNQLTKETCDLSDLIKAYYEEDEIAVAVIEEVSQFLSIGINNFNALFSIKKIYLIGTLIEKIEILPTSIQNGVKSVFSKDLILTNSLYGKYASAKGACLIGVSNFINYSNGD